MSSWSSVDITESGVKFEPLYFPEDQAGVILDRLLQHYFSVALYRQYNLVKSTSVRPSLSDSLLPSSETTSSTPEDTSCDDSVASSLDTFFLSCSDFVTRQATPCHKVMSGFLPRSRINTPETRRIHELTPQCSHAVSTSQRLSSIKRLSDNPFIWYSAEAGNQITELTPPAGSPSNVKRPPGLHRILGDSLLVNSRERNGPINQQPPFQPSLHYSTDESFHGIPNDSAFVCDWNRNDQNPSFSSFRPSVNQGRPECSPHRIPSDIASHSGWNRMDTFSQRSPFHSPLHVAGSPSSLSLFRNGNLSPYPPFPVNQYQGSPESSPCVVSSNSATIRDSSRNDHCNHYPPFNPHQYQHNPQYSPCNIPGNSASMRDSSRWNHHFSQSPPFHPYHYQGSPEPSPCLIPNNSAWVSNGCWNNFSHPPPPPPLPPYNGPYLYQGRPGPSHSDSSSVNYWNRNDHVWQNPPFHPSLHQNRPEHPRMIHSDTTSAKDFKKTSQSGHSPSPSTFRHWPHRAGTAASQSLSRDTVLTNARKRKYPDVCPGKVNPESVSRTPESQQEWKKRNWIPRQQMPADSF